MNLFSTGRKTNTVKKNALALAAVAMTAHAQTLVVKGVITASSTPVQYAAVTFVDNSNTTKRFAARSDASGHYEIGIATSVKSNDDLPADFQLEQNHPNPFSNSTVITYRLSKPSVAEITIYSMLGREVKTFAHGLQPAGPYAIFWDGTSNLGERVANGIYFYRVQAQGQSRVRKMILVTDERNLLAAFAKTNSSPTAEFAHQASASLLAGTFTVHIDNTNDTSPAIVPLRIENVDVQRNPTLNFTVNALNAATVYLDSTQQVIRGFGAANIVQWRPDMTANDIDKAFGTGPGQIGFTILRRRCSSLSEKMRRPSEQIFSRPNLSISITPAPMRY